VDVGCNFTGQPTAGVQPDVCSRIADCQIPFHLVHPATLGKVSSVSITRDSLQVGRSGDRYPVEARFSAPLHKKLNHSQIYNPNHFSKKKKKKKKKRERKRNKE